MTHVLDLDYANLTWIGSVPDLIALRIGLDAVTPALVHWLAMEITTDTDTRCTPESSAYRLVQFAYDLMIRKHACMMDFIRLHVIDVMAPFRFLDAQFGYKLDEHEHIRNLVNTEYYRIARIFAGNIQAVQSCKSLSVHAAAQIIQKAIQTNP